MCDIVDDQLMDHINVYTYKGCKFVNYKSKL